MFSYRIGCRIQSRLAVTVAIVSTAVLVACGSGGGGDSSSPSPGPGSGASVTLVGVVAKGPLKGALVTAYPVSDAGVVGSTEIAHASTDAAGNYAINVGSYAGIVQLTATAPTGTTSADEATGSTVTMPASFKLHANTVVAAVTSNQNQSASLTAYTELANSIAVGAGGVTSANIVNANGVVFTLIGMDPVATVPVPSNGAPPAGASEVQKRYGLFNAAISQLAVTAPTTTDASTLACFSAAGSDAGAKIQCATQQIAAAVTVTGSGAQAVVSGNTRLVGLTSALLAASASPSINQTGTTIASTDSYAMVLQSQETAAASGTPLPIPWVPITPAATDIATAKLFFSGLRSNAAALRTGPLSTGVVDGMRAFGDSLSGDGSALTTTTVELMQLFETAEKLWIAYTSGQSGSNASSDNPGPYTGCTVYQGTFPASLGGLGQPFVPGSVPASSPALASWVGCSSNTGPLPADGSPRYRQTIVLNMLADPTLAQVPYEAITRKQFRNLSDGQIYQQNLTAQVSGIAGFTMVNGALTPSSLVGSLPPAATAAGVLLAQSYPVNLAYTATALANGATQFDFTAGQLGVVPVGGTAATLTLDLSPGGQSSAVIPNDRGNAAQVAAAQAIFDATLSEPNGTLSGQLTVDQFGITNDGTLQAGHIKFSGSIAVAPVLAGSAGSVATWLGLALEVTNGATPVLSFSGNLNLPGLPALSLNGSVTETSTDNYTLAASYVQDGLNVSITGSQTPSAKSITFADASGVSVTLTGSGSSANVTVSGRQTAVIDKGSDMVTYSDGTFETLINP